MIVCVGDYVQLRQNFYGSNDAWLKVKDVDILEIRGEKE